VASNSAFIDDSIAILFMPYQNWNSSFSVLSPNLSSFSNSSFIWDNNFRGDALGYPPGMLVDLNGVEGVSFSACQFLNRDSASGRALQGEGIHAVNSGFKVVAGCTPGYVCTYPAVPCYFSGFTNGIDAQGANSLDPTISVDQAIFDSCSVGVNVTTDDNASVTRSDFTVGHGKGVADVAEGPQVTGCYQNIGILQDGAAQFWMEANTFRGIPNATEYWYNYGTVISNINIGSYIGEPTPGITDNVYRNTFDTLDMAVCAIGKNRNILPNFQPGLQINCNTFKGNNTAIEVLSDGDVSYGLHYEGIDGAQTEAGSDAGNTFLGDQNNIINNTINNIYFYCYNPSTEWPGSGATVAGAFKIPVSAVNTCPSMLPPLPGIIYPGTQLATPAEELVSRKQTFVSNEYQYQNTFTAYASLMDFGNTDSLAGIVDTSTNNAVLYSTLSSGAPYISKRVLKTATDSMRLTYTQMLNVLEETPDDIRDQDFLTYVNNAYVFSPTDMAKIQSVEYTITARTAQEDTMGAAQTRMSVAANTIMMMLKSAYDTSVYLNDTTGAGINMDTNSVYYMSDSNAKYIWLDSVNTWLQNMGGLWTKFARVGYYNFLGQVTNADNIFTAISGFLPSAGTRNYSLDSALYADYSSLWAVVKSSENDGRNIYELNSTEIASIDTTSFPQPDFDAPDMMIVHVTGIISGGSGTITAFPCLEVTPGYRESNNNGASGTGSMAENKQFTVYPNPTNGSVTFSYNAPGGGDITIVVTDLLGEKIMEQQPGNTSGSVTWNAANLPGGVYLYRASNAKGVIGMGKIVVIGR
jgi:hypothetical protein